MKGHMGLYEPMEDHMGRYGMEDGWEIVGITSLDLAAGRAMAAKYPALTRGATGHLYSGALLTSAAGSAGTWVYSHPNRPIARATMANP